MFKTLLISFITIFSLSLFTFDWLSEFNTTSDLDVTKINLAIRRTVHHLLEMAGDSSNRIEPIKNVNNATFTVEVKANFNYKLLPKLLDESFKIHQIKTNYDVSVLNCQTSQLELGYSYYDFLKNNDVPCNGRYQANKCYILQVDFINKSTKKSLHWLWLSPILGILLANLFLKSRKKKTTQTNTDTIIVFGNSSFNFDKLVLISAQQTYQLTYREAKLLKFFLENQNQILGRDFILKYVWEDEGITVGRSIDVFVSRLRKLLQADSSVQITTVHGIGYKFIV